MEGKKDHHLSKHIWFDSSTGLQFYTPFVYILGMDLYLKLSRFPVLGNNVWLYKIFNNKIL